MSRLHEYFLRSPLGRVARMPFRLKLAFSYHARSLARVLTWTLRSKEGTNLTYELTDSNLDYLAHCIGHVTGIGPSVARAYIDEARMDRALHHHVIEAVRTSEYRYQSDDRCSFGRRLGWYAFARALKPRVIVETGVDKGHGSVILCAALLRNASEDFPGRYFGVDINAKAGWLLQEPYKSVGEILYGDSIERLSRFDRAIDLFVNDSDHSADYEYREYQCIRRKLSSGAVILGDNAHATDSLSRFSLETGRDFLFFQERPLDHWYPGAGIGISFERVSK